MSAVRRAVRPGKRCAMSAVRRAVRPGERRLVGAVPLAGLVLAGCVGLGPRPESSRFYMLTPIAAADGAGGTPGEPSVRVGLGPVVLPSYLDRPTLVRRVGTNQLQLSASDRWAEPLPEAVAHVLQQNLIMLLGGRVVLYPWSLGTDIDTRVNVEVLRFEPAPDGSAELEARWTVRDASGARLVVRESHVTEPASGGDTAAAVAAMSRALATLSGEIASDVHDHAAASTPPRH